MKREKDRIQFIEIGGIGVNSWVSVTQIRNKYRGVGTRLCVHPSSIHGEGLKEVML